MTLPDGTIIEPEAVLGPPTPGARLIFVGDAASTHDLVEVAADADALVIESTYLKEESEVARDFGHLTATQAASLAREANVRKLFLTHLSRRYTARQVLEEAKDIFPRTTVPNDLDRFRIIKKG